MDNIEKKWHVAIEGKQQGPITSLAIQTLIKNGRIDENTLLWKEGMGNWVPIKDIEELKPLLVLEQIPTSPPPLPPSLPPPLLNTVCSKCGKENINTSKFCDNCGVSLSIQTTQQINIYCTNCGKTNVSTSKFCENCGNLLSPQFSQQNQKWGQEETMFINYIKSELERQGWNDVYTGEYMGINFNLVGSRKILVLQWNILIKTLLNFDRNSASIWQKNFEIIDNNSRKLVGGKCFLLCLIVKDISADILPAISSGKFGEADRGAWKGGGGKVLIADSKNRQVYGKIPSIPLDMHKYSSEAKEMLMNTFDKFPIK